MLKAGEKLQEKRLEKGLTLEEISQSTKIKVSFLDYIEKSEYNKLPSVSYAQGFIRNYAKYLGLSEKEILALFRREFDEDKAYRVLPKGFEAKDEFPLQGFKVKQTVIVAFVVFIFLIFYLIFQYRYAFIDPPLEIVSPRNMQIVESSQVLVSGKTDSNSTVYVNKDLVSVDSNGIFTKTISVFPGNFTISIKAVNKFGKKSEVKKTIQVKPAS